MPAHLSSRNQCNLQDEVKLNIYSYLSFADLLSVARINKKENAFIKDNHLWENKFKCFFPEKYLHVQRVKARRIRKGQTQLNQFWHDKFRYYYRKSYVNMTACERALFMIVQDNIVPSQHQLAQIQFNDLALTNRTDKTLLRAALAAGHQVVLNHIYQVTLDNLHDIHQLEIQPHEIHDDDLLQKIIFAIACRQDKNEIMNAIIVWHSHNRPRRLPEESWFVQLLYQYGTPEVIQALTNERSLLKDKLLGTIAKGDLQQLAILCDNSAAKRLLASDPSYIDTALIELQTQMIKPLCKLGARINDNFITYVIGALQANQQDECIALIKYLLKLKPNLVSGKRPETGFTTFMVAANLRNLAIIEVLLQYDTNLCAQATRMRNFHNNRTCVLIECLMPVTHGKLNPNAVTSEIMMNFLIAQGAAHNLDNRIRGHLVKTILKTEYLSDIAKIKVMQELKQLYPNILEEAYPHSQYHYLAETLFRQRYESAKLLLAAGANPNALVHGAPILAFDSIYNVFRVKKQEPASIQGLTLLLQYGANAADAKNLGWVLRFFSAHYLINLSRAQKRIQDIEKIDQVINRLDNGTYRSPHTLFATYPKASDINDHAQAYRQVAQQLKEDIAHDKLIAYLPQEKAMIKSIPELKKAYHHIKQTNSFVPR